MAGILSALFAGCSGSIDDPIVYDPLLSVKDVEITQTSALIHDKEGNTIEGAAITIKWITTKAFDSMQFEELNSGFSKSVSSSYSGIRIYSKFSSSLSFRMRPVTWNTIGHYTIRTYISDKSNSIESSGTTLPEGIQEIDCNLAPGESRCIELEKKFVSLVNSRDVTVYVARTNATDKTLNSGRGYINSTLKVTSLNNERQESGGNIFEISPVEWLGNSTSSDSLAANGSFEKKKSDIFEVEGEVITRVHPYIHVDSSSVILNESNVRNSVAALHAPVDYQVGDRKKVYTGMTKKDINYDTPEKTAILQYKSDKCYVWAVEECFEANGPSNGIKVDRNTCEKIGRIFDENSELERNIFGHELDAIETRTAEKTVWIPMNEASETGTMVNILLYDIEDDYKEGSKNGIYGYFTNGDYFPKDSSYNGTAFSNGGKYLHMDSAFAAHEDTLPTIISTIVHEFQHMIHFGQKKNYELQQHGAEIVFYNEMFSMLAEDMFQTKLKVSDGDSVKYRFRWLTHSWQYIPLFLWDNRDPQGQNYSYANAFGIGLYFAKKYGGADFVYEYMHSKEHEHSGFDSFLGTVRLYEPDANHETILRDFCLELATCNTYNTEVRTTIHAMNGYDYPMTKFDFKNFKYVLNESNYCGPYYSTLSGSIESFEPNMVDVSKIGLISNESETIQFYGNSDEGIKEYIIVVKE